MVGYHPLRPHSGGGHSGTGPHDWLRPAQPPPRLCPYHPHSPCGGGGSRDPAPAVGGSAPRYGEGHHLHPGRHRPGPFLRPRQRKRRHRRWHSAPSESPHRSAGGSGDPDRQTHDPASAGQKISAPSGVEIRLCLGGNRAFLAGSGHGQQGHRGGRRKRRLFRDSRASRGTESRGCLPGAERPGSQRK